MKHLVVVDANLPTLQTLKAAKALSHRVTFVRCLTFSAIPDSEEARQVLSSLDEIVDMAETSDPLALSEVGEAIHRRHPVDGVLTQAEFSVEATAYLAHRLDLAFTSVEGARNARHKAVARKLLQEASVPSAKFGLATSLTEAEQIASTIGFPVIVKPASGADSMYAAVAHDAEQVRAATAAILASPDSLPLQLKTQFSRGALIEERLIGDLVSVELGVIDGHFEHFGVSGRVRGESDETIELGTCTPCRLAEPDREKCRRYAETVCRVLGLDFGVFHLELMMTAAGPVLVEANPRLMGGIMPRVYELATGMHLSQQLISMALDRKFLPYPTATRCATSRKVQVTRSGTLDASLDLSALREWASELDHFSTTSLLRPGREVARGEILARIVVTGADNDAADKRAAAALNEIEVRLGVALER